MPAGPVASRLLASEGGAAVCLHYDVLEMHQQARKHGDCTETHWGRWQSWWGPSLHASPTAIREQAALAFLHHRLDAYNVIL